jgi:hypothetical protein
LLDCAAVRRVIAAPISVSAERAGDASCVINQTPLPTNNANNVTAAVLRTRWRARAGGVLSIAVSGGRALCTLPMQSMAQSAPLFSREAGGAHRSQTPQPRLESGVLRKRLAARKQRVGYTPKRVHIIARVRVPAFEQRARRREAQ